MNIITNSINENHKKFYCSLAALVFGAVGFILYLATGIIKGYTDQYSAALIVLAIIGILANTVFSVKRLDTLEMIPFVAYIICIFLFLAVNANYLAAVARAIDISSVSTSFIITIVLFFAAAILYVAGFAFKGNKGVHK